MKFDNSKDSFDIPETASCTMVPEAVDYNVALLTGSITVILFITPLIMLPIIYVR